MAISSCFRLGRGLAIWKQKSAPSIFGCFQAMESMKGTKRRLESYAIPKMSRCPKDSRPGHTSAVPVDDKPNFSMQRSISPFRSDNATVLPFGFDRSTMGISAFATDAEENSDSDSSYNTAFGDAEESDDINGMEVPGTPGTKKVSDRLPPNPTILKERDTKFGDLPMKTGRFAPVSTDSFQSSDEIGADKSYVESDLYYSARPSHGNTKQEPADTEHARTRIYGAQARSSSASKGAATNSAPYLSGQKDTVRRGEHNDPLFGRSDINGTSDIPIRYRKPPLFSIGARKSPGSHVRSTKSGTRSDSPGKRLSYVSPPSHGKNGMEKLQVAKTVYPNSAFFADTHIGAFSNSSLHVSSPTTAERRLGNRQSFVDLPGRTTETEGQVTNKILSLAPIRREGTAEEAVSRSGLSETGFAELSSEVSYSRDLDLGKANAIGKDSRGNKRDRLHGKEGGSAVFHPGRSLNVRPRLVTSGMNMLMRDVREVKVAGCDGNRRTPKGINLETGQNSKNAFGGDAKSQFSFMEFKLTSKNHTSPSGAESSRRAESHLTCDDVGVVTRVKMNGELEGVSKLNERPSSQFGNRTTSTGRLQTRIFNSRTKAAGQEQDVATCETVNFDSRRLPTSDEEIGDSSLFRNEKICTQAGTRVGRNRETQPLKGKSSRIRSAPYPKLGREDFRNPNVQESVQKIGMGKESSVPVLRNMAKEVLGCPKDEKDIATKIDAGGNDVQALSSQFSQIEVSRCEAVEKLRESKNLEQEGSKEYPVLKIPEGGRGEKQPLSGSYSSNGLAQEGECLPLKGDPRNHGGVKKVFSIDSQPFRTNQRRQDFAETAAKANPSKSLEECKNTEIANPFNKVHLNHTVEGVFARSTSDLGTPRSNLAWDLVKNDAKFSFADDLILESAFLSCDEMEGGENGVPPWEDPNIPLNAPHLAPLKKQLTEIFLRDQMINMIGTDVSSDFAIEDYHAKHVVLAQRYYDLRLHVKSFNEMLGVHHYRGDPIGDAIRKYDMRKARYDRRKREKAMAEMRTNSKTQKRKTLRNMVQSIPGLKNARVKTGAGVDGHNRSRP